MYLQNCLNQERLKIQQLFKATRDGFSATQFHSKCDNKNNLIVVIKSEHDKIFGGYTDLQWQSSLNGKYVKGNKNSFIFSLTHKKKLNSISKQHEIYDKKDIGPCFGNGHSIFISNNCNQNNESYCCLGQSYQVPEGLDILQKDSINYLAGSYAFKILDYEVFQIKI